MPGIRYLFGDATQPIGEGKKIICHICNDKSCWENGFVLALSKRWKEPEATYRAVNVQDLHLGNVQIVEVAPDILVANMIAQHDTGYDADGQPLIRYGALRVALVTVNDLAYRIGATIHMPRIGCGLAGEDWDDVAKIINDVYCVNVYVYDNNK